MRKEKGPHPDSAAPLTATSIQQYEDTTDCSVVQQKARPILFTREMVRAIRARRKTQTRRVISPQPPTQCTVAALVKPSADRPTDQMFAWYDKLPCPAQSHHARSRYGVPGDFLWVKETWHRSHDGMLQYRADLSDAEVIESRQVLRGVRLSSDERWRSSLLMPRLASRLLLRVASVQAERLQEVSPDDAIMEGFESRAAFATYWDALAARKPGRAWRDNPWVLAIRFELVRDLSARADEESSPHVGRAT